MSTSFNNDDEHDEHFLDMVFLSEGTVSKGIPWEKYEEIEIQGILKTHFEYLGYAVIWRHRDDPANEEGIDLECTNKNDGKRIVIAVKRKPNKNALGQLVELSGKLAEKRVYVYVGGSTQSFRDNINYFSNIDFWNETKLERKLNETGLTLRLIIDNSPANQAMCNITYSILRKIKYNQNQIHEKNSSQVLETLWGLKDRAVTVHKCATMIHSLFEKFEKYGKLEDNQVHNLIIWCLDYLYVYGFLTLQLEFESLSPELINLLKIVHKKTRTRSNWFELLTVSAGFMPGSVLSTLKKYDENKKKLEKIEAKYDKLNEAEKLSKEYEPLKLDVLVNVFRSINVWSHGLEGTIDYLFQYRNEIE